MELVGTPYSILVVEVDKKGGEEASLRRMATGSRLDAPMILGRTKVMTKL